MRKNLRRTALIGGVATVAILVPTGVALAATSGPGPGPNKIRLRPALTTRTVTDCATAPVRARATGDDRRPGVRPPVRAAGRNRTSS